MEDPAIAVDIYRGDAGLDTGRPQNIFVLDQAQIAEGLLQKVERANLTPGEEVTIDGGITVRFDGAAEYANYQISRDPTQGWALAATVLMLAALVGSLTIKRRRIWVRLTPVEAAAGQPARTHVEIGGLARTDRAGWGSEFDDIVDEILGRVDRDDHAVEGEEDIFADEPSRP